MRPSGASGTEIRTGLRVTAASLGLAIATVAVAVLPAAVASAASFTVSNCNPTGPGSLAAEVTAATAGATVTFAPAVSACSPIVLTSTVTLAKKITIAGPGPESVAVSGNNAETVFSVDSGVTATISGLTIENGSAGQFGGGISNNGTLILTDSTLSGNDASFGGGGIYNDGTAILTDSNLSGNNAYGGGGGGGIYNEGILTVTDSTLSSDNANAGGFGGGILNYEGTANLTNSTLWDNAAYAGGGIMSYAALVVTNSTLWDNAANFTGGGIWSDFGTLTLTSSTLSENSTFGGGGGLASWDSSDTLGTTIIANSTGGDCAGFGNTFTDNGYNIDDDGSCGFSGTSTSDSLTIDASLGSLANNGGPTQTIALSGGPAIDVVPAAQCPATDQRGAPRTAPCDIGAYDTDFPVFSDVCATGIAHYLWATSAAGDFEGLFCVNAQGNGTYIQSNGSTGTATVSTLGTITRITASGKNLQLNGTIQGTTGTVTEIAPAPRKTGIFTLT